MGFTNRDSKPYAPGTMDGPGLGPAFVTVKLNCKLYIRVPDSGNKVTGA